MCVLLALILESVIVKPCDFQASLLSIFQKIICLIELKSVSVIVVVFSAEEEDVLFSKEIISPVALAMKVVAPNMHSLRLVSHLWLLIMAKSD